MFFWRKNRTIDAVAFEVADEIYSQVPPEMLLASAQGPGRKPDKKLDRKLARAQQASARRLREFIQVQELGVYGKARINLKVIERLREHGYGEDFIDQVKDYLLLEAR